MEDAAVLLHREQPLRRVDHGGRVHRRTAPVGPRPGVQHPVVEGGRHGPAGRAPGHVGSGGAHARRQRPDHRGSGPPSATARRTKKRNGAAAIRWTRSLPR
ncbi:hypothetical protein G6F65_021827 [Rhizopus arrhizus]|nr:hypothetical protein G6F65_021827 [Rhizopus arrhizus]